MSLMFNEPQILEPLEKFLNQSWKFLVTLLSLWTATGAGRANTA
jgi:hypothetical protein